MLNRKLLGAFIKKQRTTAGLTAEKLSKYTYVSLSTIKRIECGDSGCRLETIDLILNQFGYKMAVVKCKEEEIKRIKEARQW